MPARLTGTDPLGVLVEDETRVHARAGALAAADEGVRRGARGGRAPPSFLETSTRASTMYHDIFRILTRLVQW
jgi:hypothetical protein